MTNEISKFKKLTPTVDIDLGIYSDAIRFVFDNDDIRNIAISGAYSAGKSSVLESIKKGFGDKKFINISLAHFTPYEKKDECEKNNTDLERKIINHLIHQIPARNIPQTNFSIKTNANNKDVLHITTLILISILLLLFIIFSETCNSFITSLRPSPYINPNLWLIDGILKFLSSKIFLLLCGIPLIYLCHKFISKLVYLVLNENIFKKVKIQGTEIELSEKTHESYFDKYLNEVLYLFENSGADVIAFEDIDRFDSCLIFERLHEINFLVNKHNVNNGKRVIKFFYLLRDDIFASKDRTKFFDFIIPIIPVIDGSNSLDELLRIFEQKTEDKPFRMHFLQDISLYIDDMRILKNVYNEFKIYSNKLSAIDLDQNKLLAITIYKNLFPRDFSDLQLGKGFIASFFTNKEAIVASVTSKIEEKISSTEVRLRKIQGEIAKDEQEIHILRENKLSRAYGNARSIVETEFEERKQNVKDLHNGNAEILKNTIAEYRKKIQELHTQKLCDLISAKEIDIDTIFKQQLTTINTEVGQSEYFPLLKFLISNGWIDETYNDYMTFFYAHSLSIEDKIFLRSIADKKPKDFSYQLHNVDKVLGRLEPFRFDQLEALNYDLFDRLLTSGEHSEHLKRAITQLRDTKNYLFISGFYALDTHKPLFVKAINIYWPEFFSLMLVEGNFTQATIKEYSLFTIYNSSDEEIAELNKDAALTKYISNKQGFLDIHEPLLGKIIHAFETIGVSIVNLECNETYQNLFTSIYNRSLYAINIQNISLILKTVFGESDSVITDKHFSLVFNSKESPLYTYITSNLSSYLSQLLTNFTRQKDEEIPFIYILNNDDITIDQKIAYITISTTTIRSIKDINQKTLWSAALKNNNIAPTAQNILAYFAQIQDYDDTLVAFINQNELDTELMNSEHEERDRFLIATMQCNSLTNDKYSLIFKSTNNFSYQDILPEIDSEKVDILIDLKIFDLSEETVMQIREMYPDKVINFILSNIDKYLEFCDSIPPSASELQHLLSSNLPESQKISILDKIAIPVSVLGKEYPDAIVSHIICNYLDETELERIIERYPNYGQTVKLAILYTAISKFYSIIKHDYKIPTTLFKDILSCDNVEHEIKVKYFIKQIPHINKTTCKSFLATLAIPGFENIFSSATSKVDMTDSNEKILSCLKERNWIKSFEADNDMYIVN